LIKLEVILSIAVWVLIAAAPVALAFIARKTMLTYEEATFVAIGSSAFAFAAYGWLFIPLIVALAAAVIWRVMKGRKEKNQSSRCFGRSSLVARRSHRQARM
jgi:hypothetical protein